MAKKYDHVTNIKYDFTDDFPRLTFWAKLSLSFRFQVIY